MFPSEVSSHASLVTGRPLLLWCTFFLGLCWVVPASECILLPHILQRCHVHCFCILSVFGYISLSIFPVHLKSNDLYLQRPVLILLCVAVCKALQMLPRIHCVPFFSSKLWILDSIVQQATWSLENPAIWNYDWQACKPPAAILCHTHTEQKPGPLVLIWTTRQEVILHIKATLLSFGYFNLGCFL